MPARLLVILCTMFIARAAVAATVAPASTRPVSTQLTVQGSRFAMNGTPTFLFGISYYGGLGAPEDFVRKDLADMKGYGINWVRVWVTWGSAGQDVSAVDADGKP